MFRLYLSALPIIPVLVHILIRDFMPMDEISRINDTGLFKIILPYIIFSIFLNIFLQRPYLPNNFIETFIDESETNNKKVSFFLPLLLLIITIFNAFITYGNIPILSFSNVYDINNFNELNNEAPFGILGLLLILQILFFSLEIGRKKLVPLNIILILLSTILVGKRQFIAAFIIAIITRYFFFNKKKFYLKKNIKIKDFVRIIIYILIFGLLFGSITLIRFGNLQGFSNFNFQGINLIFNLFLSQINAYIFMPLSNALYLYNDANYPGLVSSFLWFIRGFLPYSFATVFKNNWSDINYPFIEIGAGGLAELTFQFSFMGPIILAFIYSLFIKEIYLFAYFKPALARGLLLWVTYTLSTLVTYNLLISLPFGIIPVFLIPKSYRILQKIMK